jgi:hypothetical protein
MNKNLAGKAFIFKEFKGSYFKWLGSSRGNLSVGAAFCLNFAAF